MQCRFVLHPPPPQKKKGRIYTLLIGQSQINLPKLFKFVFFPVYTESSVLIMNQDVKENQFIAK